MIEWTAEQTELRKGLARWGEELSEGHLERDGAARFSWDKWRLICASGLISLPFPQRWGGLGQSLTTTMYALEGLGEHCRDSGLNFSVTTTMASTGIPLEHFGTESQKKKYLPRVCSGEMIGAHAITEPGNGSDALGMATRADRDGDHFVLNGSKAFVSNGPVADVFVVYARTRPDGGALGVTAFLVDRATPGLSVGEPTEKMGLRSSPLGELFLDDCRVPAHQVLGRVGGGFLVLDFVMKREILLSFVVNTGEMSHRLARCVDYARSRKAFGCPIGSYQSVSNKIVDMKIRLETSRKWLFDTGERLEAGEDVTADLAIAKLVTSESNVASSLDAVSIFGGYGYMAEYGLEKDVRDAVGGTIYSGTNDIQYNRIASTLGLNP
ncbi:acyl-CoA dehydrogenase family protein [Nocardiopsis salina]|uniref:acyl-CoA dehydrogenase family protein n=1 Tax=Nocardiopsis salina TaxID=245836 RepID=UPI000348BEE5|nr:acyl-CoA dehydrogenase family protein [Nocardiopsis salina]